MASRTSYISVLLTTGLVLLLPYHTFSSTTPSSPPNTTWSGLVPGKVNNLTTTFVTSTTVGLSWEKPSLQSFFNGYAVFIYINGTCDTGIYSICRQNDTIYSAGEGCTTITTAIIVCDDVVFYNVTQLLPYTDFVFKVNTNNKFLLSANTTVSARTKIGIPDKPSNVRGTALNNSAILVEWTIPPHLAGPTSYILRVMEADRRLNHAIYIPLTSYRVDGYHSNAYVVAGLMSSWRYKMDISAGTVAGNSSRSTSDTIVTLPSTPGHVQNLTVKYVTDHYMAVLVSWDCPLERERNGQINNYTVQYTGNVSLSVSAGSYYTEDPCTSPHRVYLPVQPNVNYSISAFANAEYTGEDTSVYFYADLNKMKYILSTTINNGTVTESHSKTLVIVCASCGSVVAIELIIIAAIFLKKR